MQTSERNNLGAIVLIVLGVLFLAVQVFNIDLGNVFDWPLFIIIPGVILLLIAVLGDRGAAGFAIPGAIITGTGAILWFQNVTDRWESWAYVWTLYPVFFGAAMMYTGYRHGNDQQRRNGQNFLTFGIVAFLVAAAFFELLIFNDGGGALGRYAVPAILIVIGAYLLFVRRRSSALPADKPKNAPSYTAPIEPKPKNDSGNGVIDPVLQRRIDEALSDDEPPKR
jgi:hypothetical protein